MAGQQAPEWELEARIKEMLKQYFRPEFLNRIDEVIIFHALNKDHLRQIVEIQLRHLAARLAARNLKVEVSDAARKLLAEEGYDPQFGARPLKRLIQQRIENPIATRILAGEFAEGDTIVIDVDSSRRDFSFTRGREVVEAELVE
jgi:ATP-dependent Clp protease ATP-binding subunit ClpA